MTAEGHLLFSIACTIFAKKAELTPILTEGDWWHILPSSVLTCLLPDIDHPKSFIGQRLKWISKPIARTFGHRGFTHSFLAICFINMLLSRKISEDWIIPTDSIQGMILGYISHILADMLTPSGVPLVWPLRWRFRLPILTYRKGNQFERVLCIILFIFSLWMPKKLFENIIILCPAQIIDALEVQINRFIN